MNKKIRLLASVGMLALTLAVGLTFTSPVTQADIETVDQPEGGGFECNCTDGWTGRLGIVVVRSDGSRRCHPDGCTIITQ